MTASGQLSRPPAGTFVTAYGQSLVSVVNEDRDDDGDRIKLDVKEGDRILFGKWSGTEVTLDGQELLIMKESDILGIID